MGSRLDLHSMLKTALGSNHVYFQPPESIKLVYPCIIYELSSIDTKYSGDSPYNRARSYEVTLIDPSPDSTIVDNLLDLRPSCWTKFVRHFTNDNLNHYVFTMYY